MQCTTDHTGDSLSFCTVLVQCLLSVILQDRAHVLHGPSHLVGGQASRLFSSVVMKTACTLDRCWRVGRQAAYALFGVLRDRTSTVIALLSRTVFIPLMLVVGSLRVWTQPWSFHFFVNESFFLGMCFFENFPPLF